MVPAQLAQRSNNLCARPLPAQETGPEVLQQKLKEAVDKTTGPGAIIGRHQ